MAKVTLESLDNMMRFILEHMATKADIAAVRSEMATKKDIAAVRLEMATKQELAAVHSEMVGMATKKDLERFATKDDLEKFATKDDLHHTADVMQRKIGRTEINLKTVIYDQRLRLEEYIKNEIDGVGHSLAVQAQDTERRLTALERRSPSAG